MTQKLRYGAAYYPELWPLEDIERDISRMKELGINFVRMGEFAWSTIEREPGVYDMSLFVEVVNRLGKAGIDTVFCTPGATPPVWVTDGHPERLFVGRDGGRMNFGARQHICSFGEYYVDRLLKVTDVIASALAGNPFVIGWQIDNEMKSGVKECCCEHCRTLWHRYLEKRYGTVDNLNALWRTALWSMTFNSFEQVPTPQPTPFGFMSPSLEAAYYEFSYAQTIEFQDLQIEVIRRHSGSPVTHNDSIHHHLDHARHFSNLDFASFDFYANCDLYADWVTVCDVWRNLKSGVPFWVMETSSGQNGCLCGYNRIHRSGYLVAEAAASLALGAAGFGYWLWRQQPSALEMPHGAIITAWGAPSVGYSEVREAGRFFAEHADMFLNSEVEKAAVAINYSDLARTFLMAEKLEHWDRDFYYQSVKRVASAFRASGFHIDLIPDGADFSGRRLLWSPYMPHLECEMVEQAKRFVESGGVWIVGPASGYRTREMTANCDAGLTRELEDFAGIKSLYCFSPSNSEETGEAFGQTFPLSGWSHFFESAGAEVLGKVVSGRAAGKAFVTAMKRGKGQVIVLGSDAAASHSQAFYSVLARTFCAAQHIYPDPVSPGTLVVPRIGRDGRRFRLAVNLDGKGGRLELGPGRVCEIAPYGFEVID